MQPQPIIRTELGSGDVISKKDFSSHNLVNVNGKKILYENCNFAAAIIERGYFHDASFKKCNFTGTRFAECNFRQAVFDQCTFDYADFHRCIIPVPQLLANLPAHSNVRWELLHNVRANQHAVGDSRYDTEIVRKEIEAEIAHWRDVRIRPSGYYQKYNNVRDQTKAWFHTIRLWIERHVWGHGESLTRLLVATLAAIFALSAFHLISHVSESDSLGAVAAKYVRSLLFVTTIFIDLPSTTTDDAEASPVITSCAVFLRYIIIGLAIPVLYKKIAKR